MHRFLLPFLLLAASCVAARAPLHELQPAEFADFHRPITTASPDAQRWFDQGLALCYGFDHAQAIAAFERALELDPRCAMAHWGIAFAAGPHINNPAMDDAASKRAFDSVQRAVASSDGCAPVERDLIAALATRYAWPPPEDRAGLDRAFADAMRGVYRTHPLDSDVSAIFAKSLMDLRPWDLWTPSGEPQPGTPEIVAVLERLLAREPAHIGAAHAYIHTLEASPRPERALAAADALRGRARGIAHLVHMPAHIDVRLGRYEAAIAANALAIEADEKRAQVVARGGFHALYAAHNRHFLVWAAMFDGQSALAMRHARELVAQMPAQALRDMPQVLEGFMATPLHVLVRFGRWDEILREPAPRAEWRSATAFWRYARALAFAASERVDEAVRERELFERAVAATPDDVYLGNNTARSVLEIARKMVAGEVEYRRGAHDAAFAALREAVRLDDELRYDEPWGWPQPVRHALGALLLEQERFEEAEQVYRADLARHPRNGWALHGLAEALRSQGRESEARTCDEELARAWQRADVPLTASCYCRTSVAAR